MQIAWCLLVSICVRRLTVCCLILLPEFCVCVAYACFVDCNCDMAVALGSGLCVSVAGSCCLRLCWWW